MLTQLKNCGVEYDHFIFDNGSTDGTMEWFNEQEHRPYTVVGSEKNMGIWYGIQYIIDYTKNFKGYDYVIKVDNDMEFPQDGWLKKMIEVYETTDMDILSPFVEGICDGKGGIEREGGKKVGDYSVGYVTHVGGAALLTTPDFYYETLPTDRPKASGWDTWFCHGLRCGIVEEIKVKHDTILQEKTMPDYYKRKVEESKCQ